MVDYSKWKEIEVSDDEDDTHPNIDTPSLFRWRHQARLERMEEMKREKEELETREKRNKEKIEEAQAKIKQSGDQDIEALKKSLQSLMKEKEDINRRIDSFKKKEKLQPWNVDTISKDGFSKTVINKPAPRKEENLTEEEKEQKQQEFVRKYEKEVKAYGMLRKYDDSKRYLQDHPHLACEETANYLVIWCINLEVEGKSELMSHVAHQCICMQYVLELAKQLGVDPRACVSSFFSRIQLADQQYKDAFFEELRSFKERVKERAQIRIEKAIQEAEEEERQKRLGPGGLDPVEVFESLPDPLKKCFEERDIPLLQKVIKKLPEEEARYHMKRCVDSGLWIPDAKAAANNEEDSEYDSVKDASSKFGTEASTHTPST